MCVCVCVAMYTISLHFCQLYYYIISILSHKKKIVSMILLLVTDTYKNALFNV